VGKKLKGVSEIRDYGSGKNIINCFYHPLFAKRRSPLSRATSYFGIGVVELGKVHLKHIPGLAGLNLGQQGFIIDPGCRFLKSAPPVLLNRAHPFTKVKATLIFFIKVKGNFRGN
jgi:hypothetical protein